MAGLSAGVNMALGVGRVVGHSHGQLVQRQTGAWLPVAAHTLGWCMESTDLCAGQRKAAHCGLQLCAPLPLPQDHLHNAMLCLLPPGGQGTHSQRVASETGAAGCRTPALSRQPASAPYTNLGGMCPPCLLWGGVQQWEAMPRTLRMLSQKRRGIECVPGSCLRRICSVLWVNKLDFLTYFNQLLSQAPG